MYGNGWKVSGQRKHQQATLVLVSEYKKVDPFYVTGSTVSDTDAVQEQKLVEIPHRPM